MNSLKTTVQLLIHNSANMYMEYLKLMEDNHLSLECNYRDIYRIAINKLMSIVIVIFLLSLSTLVQIWEKSAKLLKSIPIIDNIYLVSGGIYIIYDITNQIKHVQVIYSIAKYRHEENKIKI